MNDDTVATLDINGATSFTGNSAKNGSGGEGVNVVFVFFRTHGNNCIGRPL